tara:strand:+ start:3364 stop:6435 length:3072 start_codon:yes stop_codon:yes gene_type:complete
MAVDISRGGTKGGDPQYSSSNIRGVSQERGIVIGVVKANVHGSHMGVIQVYIAEMSTDESDKSQWRTVRYCTPFYSRVDNSGDKDTFNETKVPAGIVTPPPDLGTTVLCFFPQGRNADGFYFACVPDTFMMQTLPEPTLYEGYIGGEFNDNNPLRKTDKITNWKSQHRPVDFLTQQIVNDQGLYRDKVRGLNNSGYMRESPSEIIGISSKGRRITDQGKDFLKENSSAIKSLPNNSDAKIIKALLGPNNRRKGHSIALDDGDIDGNSNQIRLRTSTGHQILMNDTEGVIYVGNADGSVWIELGKSGTLDVYAQDSINFRSKNLNFHADENIKFHSKGYTQIVSEQQLHLQSEDDLVLQSSADAGITSNAFSVKASGSMNLSGGATSSIKSSGIMSVSGSIVMLQGPSLGGKTAKPVRPQMKLDPKYDPAQQRYILTRDSTITTTVDRLATHEPFVGHGQKSTATGYSGGLAGGGGLAGAFSIISAAYSTAGFSELASGVDVTDFAGTNQFADFSDFAGGFAGGNTFSDIGLDAFGGLGDTVSDFSDFAGPNLFSSGLSTGIDFSQITGIAEDFGDALTSGLGEIGKDLGDSLAKFGNGLTGTDITSPDFPGLSSLLPSTSGDLSAFGGAGDSVGFIGGFSNISPSVDSIASNISSVGGITTTWSGIGDFVNSDLGKLVTDGSGKIIDIAKQVASDYETALPELQKGLQKISAVVPGISDNLPEFLTQPSIAGLQVTDLIKQVDTGFSIGNLESIDIQGLNAGIVKLTGSNNASTFIDSVTKTIGKYGFDVEQLKANGFVRPEAVFNDQLSQSSVWTGKDGITTLNKFLSNSGIQEQLQQQEIARTYQTLVNNGGIVSTDSKEKIMAMLTGSAISSPEIAKQIRLGDANVEGLLRNTSSIPVGSDIKSVVINAMQTGGSVSKVVTATKDKNDNQDLSTLSRFTGTLKTGETIRQIGGVSYVVPAPSLDQYSGSNGGEKRQLDKRIAALENDKFNVRIDGNDNNTIVAQINDKLSELYARRHSLI